MVKDIAINQEEFIAVFQAASFLNRNFSSQKQPLCFECSILLALLIIDKGLETDPEILGTLREGPDRLSKRYNKLGENDTGYLFYQAYLGWPEQTKRQVFSLLENELQRVVSEEKGKVALLNYALEERIREIS